MTATTTAQIKEMIQSLIATAQKLEDELPNMTQDQRDEALEVLTEADGSLDNFVFDLEDCTTPQPHPMKRFLALFTRRKASAPSPQPPTLPAYLARHFAAQEAEHFNPWKK